MKRSDLPFLLATLALFAFPCAAMPPAYPPSEKKPVTDEYHGEKIVDDYRWLEDGDSPAVRAWTDAQNKFTRAHLPNHRQQLLG